jgi:hypothetical protein
MRFGRLKSGSESTGQLDLSKAEVRGDFELEVTTSFARARSVMEIDLGQGWIPLGKNALKLRFAETGRHSWPVRLRVGECPEANRAGTPFNVIVAGVGPDGRAIQTAVPATAEIVADSWLHCWWPVIAAVAGLILAGIVFHGYWSPSRFSPRLGVILSPEEDVDGEGFFHPIRAERGSGSGFYRDARIFICHDFRLSSRPRNALARLRANRKLVRIEPVAGSTIWRRTADGTWEQIQPGESTARFGDLYRNEHGSLFFELRNA